MLFGVRDCRRFQIVLKQFLHQGHFSGLFLFHRDEELVRFIQFHQRLAKGIVVQDLLKVTVWMGKWKGIRQNMLRKNNADPLKIELYNLQADIGESKDVAAENPQVVARIRTLMEKQHSPSELFPIRPLDQ